MAGRSPRAVAGCGPGPGTVTVPTWKSGVTEASSEPPGGGSGSGARPGGPCAALARAVGRRPGWSRLRNPWWALAPLGRSPPFRPGADGGQPSPGEGPGRARQAPRSGETRKSRKSGTDRRPGPIPHPGRAQARARAQGPVPASRQGASAMSPDPAKPGTTHRRRPRSRARPEARGPRPGAGSRPQASPPPGPRLWARGGRRPPRVSVRRRGDAASPWGRPWP